jgi:hypothetical protein
MSPQYAASCAHYAPGEFAASRLFSRAYFTPAPRCRKNRVATVKTPRLNLQPDGNPQPGQIRESPNVSAVQVNGRRMTPGTERRPRRRFHDQRNPIRFGLDAFQTQKVRIGKKMRRIHL